jgi:hypothetical protein
MLFSNQWQLKRPDDTRALETSTHLLVHRHPSKNYTTTFFAHNNEPVLMSREALNQQDWILTAHHDSAWRMDGIQDPFEQHFHQLSNQLTQETNLRPNDIIITEISTADFDPSHPPFQLVKISPFNPRAGETPTIEALDVCSPKQQEALTQASGPPEFTV